MMTVLYYICIVYDDCIVYVLCMMTVLYYICIVYDDCIVLYCIKQTHELYDIQFMCLFFCSEF